MRPKVKKKSYETYTLIGDCGKITIYRQDNGTCHLICDLKPKDPRPNTYQFNFDGKYVDKETDLSYKLFVKVRSTGKHQVNYAKKFASGTYGTLRTDDKVVAEELSYNMVKFQGDRYGVKIDVMIPQVALTHKFIYDQKSKGPRRLGNMGLHDKHGSKKSPVLSMVEYSVQNDKRKALIHAFLFCIFIHFTYILSL